MSFFNQWTADFARKKHLTNLSHWLESIPEHFEELPTLVNVLAVFGKEKQHMDKVQDECVALKRLWFPISRTLNEFGQEVQPNDFLVL